MTIQKNYRWPGAMLAVMLLASSLPALAQDTTSITTPNPSATNKTIEQTRKKLQEELQQKRKEMQDKRKAEQQTAQEAATKVDTACMQNAVDKRDTALASAVNAYQSAATTALTARRDSLKNAWGMTDRTQRRTSLRQAWTDYRTALRKAVTDLRTAKRNAWKQFYTDRQACGKGAAADDPTTEGTDANL